MDCPRIPEMPYSDFSDRLHRKGTEWRLPLGASVEITERCNLNCAHCYINLPANAGQTRAIIESGAASVNISVPEGVAARIRTRRGAAAPPRLPGDIHICQKAGDAYHPFYQRHLDYP